jgi:uncharacterized protein (DUF433 family)
MIVVVVIRMATQQVLGIVSGEESALHDEPHIEGSRITVRYIQRSVEERGLHPATVADRHQLDLGDVYAALTYYHTHPDEMRRVEQQRADLAAQAEAMTTLTPPEE